MRAPLATECSVVLVHDAVSVDFASIEGRVRRHCAPLRLTFRCVTAPSLMSLSDVEPFGLVMTLTESTRTQLITAKPRLGDRTLLLGEARRIAQWATAGPITAMRAIPGVPRIDGTGRHTGRRSAEWLVRQCTHSAGFDILIPEAIGAHDGSEPEVASRITAACEEFLSWYAEAVTP